MKKTIRKIPSSLFENEYNNLIIWEPEKMDGNTPVIFIYDGQILKTEEKEFFEKKGIEIFKHSQKIIGSCVIIAVNSMRKNDKHKYKKRVMELKNYKNKDYAFMKIIRNEVLALNKIYIGPWFGIGFSLSGWLIGKENIFDLNIMISPFVENDIYNLSLNSVVFFGSKEYYFFSNKKINKPLLSLQEKNKDIKFFEIKKMKHTFKSWNKYMHFILKESIATYLKLKK
ncbi:hypothetical protein [Candidatus Mycoplasma mahonii]|uniref:hypothetical protein n=1 Tax=Candidatus Mycoplasma mahonii TaxID=3004105 RepID=UPI0026F1054F|nr:hypothetical protein [Candidatus Mycoplasma mahonii]WKX02670.1 hypothetical protein O3I44_01155 [Candidatus Mycoplasma mahonii]